MAAASLHKVFEEDVEYNADTGTLRCGKDVLVWCAAPLIPTTNISTSPPEPVLGQVRDAAHPHDTAAAAAAATRFGSSFVHVWTFALPLPLCARAMKEWWTRGASSGFVQPVLCAAITVVGGDNVNVFVQAAADTLATTLAPTVWSTVSHEADALCVVRAAAAAFQDIQRQTGMWHVGLNAASVAITRVDDAGRTRARATTLPEAAGGVVTAATVWDLTGVIFASPAMLARVPETRYTAPEWVPNDDGVVATPDLSPATRPSVADAGEAAAVWQIGIMAFRMLLGSFPWKTACAVPCAGETEWAHRVRAEGVLPVLDGADRAIVRTDRLTPIARQLLASTVVFQPCGRASAAGLVALANVGIALAASTRALADKQPFRAVMYTEDARRAIASWRSTRVDGAADAALRTALTALVAARQDAINSTLDAGGGVSIGMSSGGT